MSYRADLPQLQPRLFLTDGGLETTLIYHDDLELEDFASFPLLRDETGRAALARYFDSYVAVAVRDGVGIVLETPTWRASPDWAERLGYSSTELERATRDAVGIVVEARNRVGSAVADVVVSGNVGPRGDGYAPTFRMTADEARAYHAPQVETFAATEADMVCALTINYPEEAVGIVRAADDAAMPVAISFTVETDGVLPSGDTLAAAIQQVDDVTDQHAAYFMINCAHPKHFAPVLEPGTPWMSRVRGIRANASTLSHAELDAATELDAGDPESLAHDFADLHAHHPQLTVLGGCCGTDARHIDAISRACS